MKYYLNMPEIEKRMRGAGIKSISQLLRESKLIPAYFFSKQSKNHNKPVISLHQVYMISKRLGCKIEDILIAED